jgi:hypothetical protein
MDTGTSLRRIISSDVTTAPSGSPSTPATTAFREQCVRTGPSDSQIGPTDWRNCYGRLSEHQIAAVGPGQDGAHGGVTGGLDGHDTQKGLSGASSSPTNSTLASPGGPRRFWVAPDIINLVMSWSAP